MRRDEGFTLIELLVVIAIIGIISGVAALQLSKVPLKAKESVLKEDLYSIRDVIDQYFADKGKYPESLDTLVQEGYLRKIPVDPLTDSSETWEVVHPEAADEDTDASGGVVDVKSGSDRTALDGSRYSEW